MKTIEQIKHDGSVFALKDEIDSLVDDIKFNIWHNHKNNNVFTKLSNCIENSREMLDRIEELFKELQKMEPENK